MSKRKIDISVIKAKRKSRRIKQKQKRRNARTGHAKTNARDKSNVLIVANKKQRQENEVNEVTNFQTDDKPSTSRDCQKQITPVKNNNKKRSPWRNAGGRVNKFKKIIDDQAKKLVKRSVYLMKDNQTPRKFSPHKKFTKSYVNNSKKNRKLFKRNTKDTLSIASLEEGEVRTDDESVAESNSKNDDQDEDDCVVIEPTIDEITIDDDNDNDDEASCNEVSSCYQSLVHSFKERVSSTPYHKTCSNALELKNSETDDKSTSKTLPFFVDICGRRSGFESVNSTDTFIDYSKLSTLGDKSIFRHRKVRLKENNCSEIINLDDNQYKEQSSTLKGESREEDDSVIFVSETNKNDFIAIVDDTIPPHKILKISEIHNTPINRHRLDNKKSLFTLSETKKLNEYNENAYNPSADKTLTNSKRMVIIDGSNVAFKHGLNQAFSVKGLKIAIEYFEKMGHEVKVVIPQFRMNKGKSSDPEELEKLQTAGKIVQTPCKNLPGLTSTSYDDRFILQLAFELDAAIVSNDNYRDLLFENPAFKKIVENRVIGYTWCNDIFILPKDPYGKWGPTLHTILNR